MQPFSYSVTPALWVEPPRVIDLSGVHQEERFSMRVSESSRTDFAESRYDRISRNDKVTTEVRHEIARIIIYINITPCGLCRSSLFLSFWLVQNLSCDPEQSEGFPTSGNDTENKYSISDALRFLPQGSSFVSFYLEDFFF